jgi:hypothetical protein
LVSVLQGWPLSTGSILKTDTSNAPEESLMSYAVSPQADTDYWSEYSWLTKKYGDSETLHELRKSFCAQKSGHSDFFAWFSVFESHLAEIDTSKKEAETYKTFVETVSLLTESQDPYTARHQKRYRSLREALLGKWGYLPT